MNKKYIATFKGKTQSPQVTLEFAENGKLKAVTFSDNELDLEQMEWIWVRLPMTEMGLSGLGFVALIEQVPTDLSFNAFWEEYDYKVGNRGRAMKLWTVLNDAERMKALSGISKYKQWLAQRPQTERLYPETYLSQKRYNNQFKI